MNVGNVSNKSISLKTRWSVWIDKLKPVKETNEKIGAIGFKPLTDAVINLKDSCDDQKSYQDVVVISPAAEELDDKSLNWLKLKLNKLYFKSNGPVEKMKMVEENNGVNIDWDDIDSVQTEGQKIWN